MIRVTVELVPFGDEEQKKTIGSLVLANVQQHGFGLCSYDAAHTPDDGEEGLIYKQGVQHMRKDGFWELVERILNADKVEDLNDVKLSTERLAERLEL